MNGDTGINLNCKSTGQGPDVVILHGLFGDLNNWRAQSERLSEQYHVHSMDLRNHGSSPHAAGMTYKLLAADVASTCESLGIKKIHLIGHSMGGKTAMQISMDYPDLVERLIVVDIGPRRYAHGHTSIIEGLKLLASSTLSSRQQANELLIPFAPDNGIRSFLLKNLQRNSDGNYELRINIEEIASQYDAIADGITPGTIFDRPVLLIKGAESDYLTDRDREPIAKLFNNTSLKIIDGAGHWPHSEKPEVVYKILADFLAAGASNSSA